MATAASIDQKNRSLPYPNGCLASAVRRLRATAASRNSSLKLSATEWAASDSRAGEPLNSPPTTLAVAITKLTASARTTVTRVSASAVPKECGSRGGLGAMVPPPQGAGTISPAGASADAMATAGSIAADTILTLHRGLTARP
jgi:hypothetical protein